MDSNDSSKRGFSLFGNYSSNESMANVPSVSWIRGVDDELNTVASGGLTGLLYRSTAGLKSALRGSLYGVAASSVYVMLTSKERLQTYM
ncbi:unnamed protein product [Rotaria magnacalcarata]|uniref:Uncharacterized protein n=1 Tax=Rotaria magnacalcarata TaxID=392030 RepID=A0A816VR66_9BILA|nr:unnamed protein product [Rotaria magnacalcarata]